MCPLVDSRLSCYSELTTPHSRLGFHQTSTRFRVFLSQSTAWVAFALEPIFVLRQSASNATGWNDLKRVITERAQRNVILELPRLLPRARRCKVLGRFTPAKVTRKHDGSEAGVPRRSLRDQRRGGANVHRRWVGGVQARKELGSAVTDSPSPHGTQGRRVRQLTTAGMKVRSAWLQQNASSIAADDPRCPVRDDAQK